MTALSSPKRKDGLLLERVSYGTSGHWDTEHNDQNRGWSENLQTIEDLQLYFTAQLSRCRQQAHKPLQQGRGRLFSRETDKHRKGTADPWITQVWTAGLHLQADFLQQKTLQYYSIHRQLNPWIQRNHRYTEDAAKSLQSGPTLCDPIDGSPPGSPVPGILQARTLEWVAISFSNAWEWKVKVKLLSHVRLLATPWTAGYQAPPAMRFSRQEHWSGVPLPSPQGLLYLVQGFSTVQGFGAPNPHIAQESTVTLKEKQ